MSKTNDESKFINPYREIEDYVRVNLDVDLNDCNYIRLIRPTHGTLSTTFGILFSKLIAELKKQNIHDITHRKQFEHFLTNFQFVLPNSNSGNSGIQRSSSGKSRKQAN